MDGGRSSVVDGGVCGVVGAAGPWSVLALQGPRRSRLSRIVRTLAQCFRHVVLALIPVSGFGGRSASFSLSRVEAVGAEARRRGAVRTLLMLAVLGGVAVQGRVGAAQSAYGFSAQTSVGSTVSGTVTVTIATSGTVSEIDVLTMGASGKDFTAGTQSGGCTTSTSVTAPTTCQYVVNFTPKYPGRRDGAVVLVDRSGSTPVVLGTQLVSGTGVASLSVMEAGELMTVAGNGHLTDTNGSGPQTAANTAINEPLGVAFDGSGNFYYTDSGGNLIQKVDSLGNLTTVAGTGAAGFSADGTAATLAELSAPAGIVLDGAGNIYFADSGNNLIREVVAVTGKIYTVAGNRTRGWSGDGGAATSAELNTPEGLAIDPSGNLFIADTFNNVVRRVDASTKDISTYAGNYADGGGWNGSPGTPTSTLLDEPWGLYATADGSLYIADFLNNVIREVNPAGTSMSIVMGNGSLGYTNNLTALSTEMNHPAGVVVDAAGDIIVSDSENDAILKMNGTTQMVTRIGGNENPGWDADGVDADPTLAEFNKPYGLALDGMGDVLIADRINLRVREILGALGTLSFQETKRTQTEGPTPQVIENDGNAQLNITSVTAVQGPAANDTNINSAIDATGTTCVAGAQLAVGSQCTVQVDFHPMELSVAGAAVYGLISVVSNSASSAVSIEPFGVSDSIFPTTTTVTSSANPTALGSNVTLTATMTTSNTSALIGTVIFYDNGMQIGGTQGLIRTTNTATLTLSTLTLGPHSITAVYSGDSGDATSTSPTYSLVVRQGTTVAVTSSANPSQVYGTITFTATATPTVGSTTPGGTMTFSIDGTQVSSALAMSGGAASYSTSTLTAGTHSVTAVYSGDANDLGLTSSAYSQTVNVASTSSVLGTSSSSVLVEGPVTFTATVTGNAAGAVPSGQVWFYNTVGGTTTRIGTGLLTGSGYVSSATFPTSSLPVGSDSITAVYQGDTNYGTSTTAAMVETVNKISTGATVSASANATIAGATASFTVNVAASSSTTPNLPLTGTVTLTDGATTLGTGSVTASGTGPATATVVIRSSALVAGAQSITATYSGDGNYLGSGTTPLTLTVANAATTTVLGESAGTIIAQKPVTFTATVAGTGGTPTGSVLFKDGGTTIGTGTMTNGVAVLTSSTLAVGTHTITATYSGDTNDATSGSNSVTVVVQSATTATSLTVAPNPSAFGHSVTMTAGVTGNGGLATGTVTFLDGGAAIGTGTLNGAGVASFTTTALADGTHTITASYGGDANDTGSASSSVSLLVLQTATLTVTTTTGNPAEARTDVHLVATLTPLQGIQPTGSITFLDGGTVIGTGVISGTTATFDTTTLAVATHEITVSYAGDGKTEAVTSVAYPLTVSAVGSSVSVTASANPAVVGQALTLTASATSATGVPTGTVKFLDGGTVLGTSTLTNGKAVLATSALAAGTHSIEAVYSGDADDTAGTSPAISVLEQRATTTTVTSSVNPVSTLSAVVITATVANGGGVASTGTMTFTEDGTVVGTAQMTGGSATLSMSSMPVGAHQFTATYSGDTIDLPSTSAGFTQTVQLRPTTDVLTSSATSLSGGQQVTLISLVQYSGPTPPTGSVTFLAGTLAIGTEQVNAAGIATVTALLGDGPTVAVTAVYSGDANYATSTSAITTIAIGPAPDFNMGVTPSTFTLQTKAHTPLAITLTSMNNFSDTFALGCAGLPAKATCTFSKDSVLLPAGGAVTVTVTVDTGDPLGGGTATTTSKNQAPGLFGNSSSGFGKDTTTVMACLMPGCFLMGLLGLRMRRFRKVGGLLLLLCLMGATTVLSGCAGLNMGSTAPGSYNFRVTATGATGIEQSINVSMTVTQ
jgi:hypothetical protein